MHPLHSPTLNAPLTFTYPQRIPNTHLPYMHPLHSPTLNASLKLAYSQCTPYTHLPSIYPVTLTLRQETITASCSALVMIRSGRRLFQPTLTGKGHVPLPTLVFWLMNAYLLCLSSVCSGCWTACRWNPQNSESETLSVLLP